MAVDVFKRALGIAKTHLDETDFLPAVMENIPASEATTIAALKESFNALLDALKDAGYMEADAEAEDDGGSGSPDGSD